MRGRTKWGLFLITYISVSVGFVCFSYIFKHSHFPMFCVCLGKPNSINYKQEFPAADSSAQVSGLAGLYLQMLQLATFKISPWQQMSLLLCLTLERFLTSGTHESEPGKPIFQGTWFYGAFNNGSCDWFKSHALILFHYTDIFILLFFTFTLRFGDQVQYPCMLSK